MFKKLAPVVFSALLLHGALWGPQYLFWGSFVWLLPLFYSALTFGRSPSFAQGFLWGSIFFSLHLYPVIQFFSYQAHGIGRFIIPIFLLCYGALHTGILFWLARITAILAGDNTVARALSWVFWTYSFVIWAPEGLLWISGQYIGYPFFFPLLPLAQYPKFLLLLSTIGRHALTLLLVSFSMLFSLTLITRKQSPAFLMILFFVPFAFGFFVPREKENLPPFFKKIGYVCPPDSEQYSHPMDVAQKLYYRMRILLNKYPEVKYIVMPELSYRFSLNKHKHVINMWNNNVLHDEVQLFIGACRSEGNKIFNSLYWIKDGGVEQWYDKSQLMPLVEYVPSWCKKIPFIGNSFLSNNEFSGALCRGKLFDLGQGAILEPCICAELFFGKRSTAKAKTSNLINLSIINDSIFNRHFQHLMLLWNSFKAIENNQSRLHIGYEKAFWITPFGKWYFLLQDRNVLCY